LLSPLPFENPERIVNISEGARADIGDGDGVLSIPDLKDLRAQTQTLEYLAGYWRSGTILTDGGEPERAYGALVNADYFPLLGVRPALGRTLTREDEQPGAPRVIVISHGLWQRRFGGNPSIVGQQVNFGKDSLTVIGVMPPGFEFPFQEEAQDYWEPLFNSSAAKAEENNRGAHSLPVIGKLKPGVSIEQARAELDTIARRLEQQYPDTNTGTAFSVVPTHEVMVRHIRPALLVLLAAVGFVLLIACANVANLLLARAATRAKEIAIRTALGAGRRRIVMQLLTESLLLALVGGGLGLLLAMWGVDLLVAASPADIPRAQEIGLDARVVIFTLGVSVLTGVIFGLAPALQASKPDLNEALKDGGRGSTEGLRHNRVRSLLVVSEVALSLVLLIGAGLLIKSFVRLMNTDPGFDRHNLLALDVPLSVSKYDTPEKQVAFFQQAVERAKVLPGVRDAGLTDSLPLGNGNSEITFNIVGRAPFPRGQEPAASIHVADSDYFRTMSIPVKRGRVFTDRDTLNSPQVLVVNETFARMFFPNEDPIGKSILIGDQNPPPREIVGVVGDVRYEALDADTHPEYYTAFAQNPERRMNLVVRTQTNDPANMTAAVRGVIKELDSRQAIWQTRTMEQLLAKSVAGKRFNMLLLGVFAGVALVLAALGIYGVMAYSVTRRTHEIGIRIALGAKHSDVLKLVVGQGMLLAGIGLALGLAVAALVTRVMASLLYGVSATDAATFATITALLAVVAFIACYIPARRATKVDPMIALRYE
ncbi:MAG TPA: ABC transporter permease, partial [Pyrinomonadaceae bacterium]|nr:ABC transporter permease [Pyrinomonadaceae bacterium]